MFSVTPSNHLSKRNHCGCPKCNGGVRLNQDDFIKRINRIFNNKYDTSLVNYINSDTKVKLICPIHGVFEKKPCMLLQGMGCPKCQYSKIENKTDNILRKHNIDYIYEYAPNFLKSSKFGHQSLDFYLPEYNVAIECQGKQHFIPVSKFGGDIEYEKNIKRDLLKYDKCKQKGIKIYYYTDKKTYSKIKGIDILPIYKDNLYASLDDIVNLILQD